MDLTSPTNTTPANWSEIDQQVATAKQYPRDIKSVAETMRSMATMDLEMAESCFYCLERKKKGGGVEHIRGPSIKLAEIALSCWGNVRAEVRIASSNSSHVTAEAACWDLQTNTAIKLTHKRQVFNFSGAAELAAQAASAIALRNAIFKIIPSAITKTVFNECMAALQAEASKTPIDKRVQRMIEAFAKFDVSIAQLCEHAGIENRTQFTEEHLSNLTLLHTAIKTGETTAATAFGKHNEDNGEAFSIEDGD